MTKHKQSEIAAAVAELRETLNAGDTVYTVLRGVSRSGMMRWIDLYVIENGEPRRVTHLASRADVGSGYDNKREALKMSGCGMDMGFAAVYEMSRKMFNADHPHVCKDPKTCPSNDHNNAYSSARQNQCIVCRKEFTAAGWTRSNGHHAYNVCSEACATGPWVHSDGGYALKHRWM
jgi:hypothetical protein